ncbi:hypothetical protein ACFFRR_006862 [Megaselia abdita]
MKFFLMSACILLLGSGLNAQVDDCLEKDSISCLQLTIFRQAKSFFDNPNIELVGGVSLMKSNEGRQGKSIEDNSVAVETAPSVEARNGEMGTYFMESAKKFFAERSLNFNFVDTARSVARAIPDDIKADISEIVTEARTLKKKKTLKKLLPLIKIVGVKIALLVVGSLFGIFVMAKKALFVSGLAFLISLVSGAGAASGLLGRFSGLFGGKSSGSGSGHGSGQTTTYIVSSEPASYSSGSSAGWSSGGSNAGWSSSGSGWDTNGAYSSPVAQYAAYRGQPQAAQQQQ